jgi:ABC-type sugar transport system permease subunit
LGISRQPWRSTLFLAGLQTIPEELLEAAKVEGAGPIRRFIYVTFPLLRETTLIVLAITALNALKAYDIIYAMTNAHCPLDSFSSARNSPYSTTSLPPPF